MAPIRVGCVSYLNSKPFVEGLKNSGAGFDISLDIPSVCASKLMDGTIDVGLVPVAVIPALNYHEIISPYCISADGPVRTVVLASQMPLHDIKKIFLDYQSLTSVNLAKILAQHFWDISPLWEKAQYGYENKIEGDTAGVIIGDRVFDNHHKFSYIYDLAEEWGKFTGKPFVFACWVANKPLSENIKEQFGELLKSGIEALPVVIKNESSNYPDRNIEDYFWHNIQFDLTDARKEGLELFLDYLKKIIGK